MAATALVTGASGFIGAAVVRRLLQRGWRVRALMRPESNRANLDGLGVEAVTGRLEDEESLALAVAGCAAVLHIAADYRLWAPDPDALYRTNVTGSRALMRAALDAGVERVVHTSSVATLGHLPGDVAADEETPTSLEEMIGAYKRSKFLAERAVLRMVAEDGLPAVVVNPSTPVGPGDIRPTPTGRMIAEAARGRIPAFVNTGLNIVHVDDVAEGHVLALEKGRVGQRYVLGGDNLTLAAILAVIAKAAGRRAPTVRLPRAVVWPMAVAAELLARFTGVEPLVTCDGLRMSRACMYFRSDKAERELGYRHRPAEAALIEAATWALQRGYGR
jgi:dihydroflavonol-4-reductase